MTLGLVVLENSSVLCLKIVYSDLLLEKEKLSISPKTLFPAKKQSGKDLIGLALWTWSIKEEGTSLPAGFRDPRDFFFQVSRSSRKMS